MTQSPTQFRVNQASDSRFFPRLSPRCVLSLLGVGLSTTACVFVMEQPAFDPTGFNTYHTGSVLSVLWSIGLLVWALRAVRSHQSRFGMMTIITITTVLAIGFVNIFVAMMIVCLAMVFDVGVIDKTTSRIRTTWRTIQVAAGITGLSHACRIMYHWIT